MLKLVERAKDKKLAQETFQSVVCQNLTDQGTHKIGFPSGNFDEKLYSNGSGSLWAVFSDIRDSATPRSWNGFGIFDPKRFAQVITVEINIPTTSNSARVAGFFARNSVTGEVYLMHDGSVGGGKAGVGRAAFLAWSKTTLEDVIRDDGSIRAGIIIGRVDSSDITGRLWRFVKLVKGFKDAVARGELDDPAVQQAIADWEAFKSESFGRRRGSRRSEIDYISYHGDVVEHLFRERSARCTGHERVLNNKLVDLFVRDGQSMTEIYEVKTSVDRQSIYTGIGQLFTHSAGAPKGVKRYLVLPEGRLPSDIEQYLAEMPIELRRFSISIGNKTKILFSE